MSTDSSSGSSNRILSLDTIIIVGAIVALVIAAYLFWPSSDTEQTIAVGDLLSATNHQAQKTPTTENPEMIPVPQQAAAADNTVTVTSPPVQVTPPTRTLQLAVTPEPVKLPPSPIPLLNQSDAYSRTQIAGIFLSSKIDSWLPQSDLIRRFVVLIESMSGGNLIRGQLGYMPIVGKFSTIKLISAKGEPQRYRIDPKSYRRYDALAQLLSQLQVDDAINLYHKTKPLLTQAYKELGLPATNFDLAFIKAIDEILKTPEIDSDIKLLRPSVMYRFEDPSLESLSKVQKQFIRMGPENIRTIKAKLRDIRTALR